ncbi:hypothetical protein BHE74_00023381 [Ensete ventricosum]|nr:hypothetical protein BHE74_00023381 [Ensete ventricosum]
MNGGGTCAVCRRRILARTKSCLGFYKYHTQYPLGDPLQLTRNTHFVAHGSFAHLQHVVSDKKARSSSFPMLLELLQGWRGFRRSLRHGIGKMVLLKTAQHFRMTAHRCARLSIMEEEAIGLDVDALLYGQAARSCARSRATSSLSLSLLPLTSLSFWNLGRH